MKKIIALYLFITAISIESGFGQTLYVPDGTSGVSSSSNSNVGVGTSAPEARFHIYNGNYGVRSQLAIGIIESNDAQLDLISSSEAKWGSSINLIEGAGSSNTDVWSIVRQTTNGGGNSGLMINYGSGNSHANPNIITFAANRYVGIGTEMPQAKLHVQDGDYGTRSIYGKAIIESLDAQLDIISHSDGSYGSGINLIEGNGNSNKDIWSIVRQTTGGVGNSSLQINYGSNNQHVNPNVMTFSSNGSIGVGTTTPDSRLTVAGKIHAQEIKVTTTAGADFVFEADYPLRSLEETEQFIKENKHLPDIPSADEMVEDGITLGEMNVKLLQKIEELTLYVIELNKKDSDLSTKMEELERENEKLRRMLKKTIKNK